MTDSLIKNLRDLATFAHADLSVADEAADEIERLREERDEARRGEHRENENTPTWAELTAYWKARAEELERDRVVAPHATTENERLREALEEVRPLVMGANHSKERYPKARIALGEKE